MFGFILKNFIAGMWFLSCNGSKCDSMNKQECRIRPKNNKY